MWMYLYKGFVQCPHPILVPPTTIPTLLLTYYIQHVGCIYMSVKVWFAWFYHYYGFLKSLQVFVGSAYLSLTKKTFFKNEVVFLCEIARNRYGIWVLVWNLALPILSPLFLREGFAGELESWQFRSMKFTKIFLFKS